MNRLLLVFTVLTLLTLGLFYGCTPTNPVISNNNDKDPAISVGCMDDSMVNANLDCDDTYQPVCGCNGQSYRNECLASKAGVVKMTKNACTDCVDKSKMSRKPCNKMLDPVCGCDGATYSNPCEADNAGVLKYTKGRCTKALPTTCFDPAKKSDSPCPMNYLPVCGCDNKTYSNECVAKTSGILKWTKGKCGEQSATEDDCIDPNKISNKGCPENWNPVCGCDGKTYGNKCAAQNAGVIVFVKGECGGSKNQGCIDESKINPEGICTMQYDPVCGCDGKTYSNDCMATHAGVTKWKKGACPK